VDQVALPMHGLLCDMTRARSSRRLLENGDLDPIA